MLENEKKDFFLLLQATLEVYSQLPPSQAATHIWWNSLIQFNLSQVRKAFDEHIRRVKFAPRPSDILDVLNAALPDGRPCADEAWAMMPRDEYASCVMTEEMSEALHLAQPLLNEGDQVAARMAFKQAYERLVDANKRAGVPPKWFPSLGQDKDAREACLAQAVRLGRLGATHAIGLLPPDKVVPMLEVAGANHLALGYKPIGDDKALENIARIKEMLARKMTVSHE